MLRVLDALLQIPDRVTGAALLSTAPTIFYDVPAIEVEVLRDIPAFDAGNLGGVVGGLGERGEIVGGKDGDLSYLGCRGPKPRRVLIAKTAKVLRLFVGFR